MGVVGSRRDGLEGLRAAVPVVVGYLPAAVAFGVVARQAGLSLSETVLMSLVVYSGASQFALAGLVAAGASWIVMAATALVLSLRHVLYGPALAPRLRRLGFRRGALAAFGLTDEVFAVAFAKLPRGAFGWLLGLEAGAYLSWALGSWAGAYAGAAIREVLPSLEAALSFALPALFVALLVSLLSSGDPGLGASTIGAVVAAGAGAAVLQLAGLGSWGILAAGLAGPASGLLLRRRRADEG